MFTLALLHQATSGAYRTLSGAWASVGQTSQPKKLSLFPSASLPQLSLGQSGKCGSHSGTSLALLEVLYSKTGLWIAISAIGTSTFVYICCNFGQIFCTNLIQFFSVQNMGHDQLKKCSKYHLVSLLDEKQRSTFAIFWTLFIQVSLLTNSALFES